MSKEKQKAWRIANKDALNLKKRAYRLANKDKIKAYQCSWATANKDMAKAIQASWIKANPEKVKRAANKWRHSHPEKVKARQDRWRARNKTKLVAYQVRYNQRRLNSDPVFRIVTNLRSRIHYALKKGKGVKSGKSMELLGCSLQELREHIQGLWQPGMSWDNYGMYGWHIDHRIPCSAFDLTDPEQQKTCFHYTNLQPL